MSSSYVETPIGKFSLEEYIEISPFPETCYVIAYNPKTIQGKIVIRRSTFVLAYNGLLPVFSDSQKANTFRGAYELDEWGVGPINIINIVKAGRISEIVLNLPVDCQPEKEALSAADAWLRLT